MEESKTLEKFLPHIVTLVASGLFNAVLLLYVLRSKVETLSAEQKDIHLRISKKDEEHTNDMREIRSDIKEILRDMSFVKGFARGQSEH